MADSETIETTEQDQQQQQSQSDYDKSFYSQMGLSSGASTYDFTTQVVQAFFDNLQRESHRNHELLDEQIRAARRITDMWGQKLILQETTQQVAAAVAPVVAQQVITQLRRDPSWAKQLVQEASKR